MENLEKLRKARHMTRKDMALALGVTRVSYSSLERGERTPTIEVLQGICQVLHIRIETLLTPEERERFACLPIENSLRVGSKEALSSVGVSTKMNAYIDRADKEYSARYHGGNKSRPKSLQQELSSRIDRSSKALDSMMETCLKNIGELESPIPTEEEATIPSEFDFEKLK